MVNNDIHINIKLIHCNTGNVILAVSFEERLDDIYGLQGKVASGITNVLMGTFDKKQNLDSKGQKINLQEFKYYHAGIRLLKENYLTRNTLLVNSQQ